MVDELLLEKIPIAGISRVTEISEPWLFGWHLTAIPERLSGCMLGAAIMLVPRHYGNHCHQSTVNAPFVTLIFGLHMSRFFPKTDAVGEESGKTNRIERFNLTLRQRISRLVRRSKLISELSGILFTIIMLKLLPNLRSLHIKHYQVKITNARQLRVKLRFISYQVACFSDKPIITRRPIK